MRLFVLKPIKLKKAGRVFDVKPGAVITISKPEKAQGLIQSGHVRPSDEGGTPVAAKIYSRILDDVVWVAFDPSFIGDGDGIVVYSIEEIRTMRGADEHTMRLIHACKKEMGSILVKEAIKC